MLLVSNMVTAITKVVVPSFVTTLIFYYYVYFTNTIGKQLPVILLAIRQKALDLKDLIPGNGPPEIQD